MHTLARTDYGSSPRGRGTPRPSDASARCERFIPAWAGNTSCPYGRCATRPVHPRVGGEHPGTVSMSLERIGSSPRGRGTPRHHRGRAALLRFIPAWAGNTLGVGPEQALNNGSSPRGRGTPSGSYVVGLSIRFIPAWAGNTTQPSACTTSSTVHPRVGGEHRVLFRDAELHHGSSPRGRGTRDRRRRISFQVRFIPAWAGNTGGVVAGSSYLSVHPRVGGEHVGAYRLAHGYHGSSPRGRGTPEVSGHLFHLVRFIPAWAGNTLG